METERKIPETLKYAKISQKEDAEEEKPTPKFKVGDIVRVIRDGELKGAIAEITYVDESDPIATYQIDNGIAFEHGYWFNDSELELYTKPENIENMEEFNLAELLKDAIGEAF